jgi:hypothetical protein
MVDNFSGDTKEVKEEMAQRLVGRLRSRRRKDKGKNG